MSKEKKPTKSKAGKTPKKGTKAAQPKKVEFSHANTVKVVKELIKLAQKDPKLRARLSRSAGAKSEVGKYFTKLPSDWKRYKFTFTDILKEDVFHFQSGLDDFQLIIPFWKSIVKPCKS